MSVVRKYNHLKDPEDPRDYLFKVSKPIPIPESFTLQNLPEILDQGQLGSCCANELSNALKFLLTKEHQTVFQPSRLFIYYFARKIDNSDTNQDTGITIRGGMKSIATYGVCWENTWPYDITKFTIKPSQAAITASLPRAKNFQYHSVPQNLLSIQQALLSGFPIVIGIQVYDSFESAEVAKTGIVPMPVSTESNLGGHCVCIIGFNNATKIFKLMNSWGKLWGQQGMFTLPYNYVLDPKLADSFWVASYFTGN